MNIEWFTFKLQTVCFTFKGMCNNPSLPHKYIFVFPSVCNSQTITFWKWHPSFLLQFYNKKNSKTQFHRDITWEVEQFETFQIVLFSPEIDFAIRNVFVVILFIFEKRTWNPICLNMVENKKQETHLSSDNILLWILSFGLFSDLILLLFPVFSFWCIHMNTE